MKPYTAVILYEDNWQPAVLHLMADSLEHCCDGAVEAAAEDTPYVLCAVFAGHLNTATE